MKLAAFLVATYAVLAAAAPSVGAPSGPPAMATGVFDTSCMYSHTLPDDPLVHPNMPGMSHVHDFFGNRTTKGSSTGNGLLAAVKADAAKTTCTDALDASAYWTPALYQDGTKLRPEKMHVYYRRPGNSTPAKPFPVGFGMITHEFYWWCGPGTTKYRDGTVPACPNGRLFVTLSFPMCWDGVHRFTQSGAHVSFGMKAKCDAAHPVRIPALTAFVEYKVDGKNHKYVLASGDPTTAHADFFNAWEPSRLAHLVDKCLNHGRVESCKDDKHR